MPSTSAPLGLDAVQLAQANTRSRPSSGTGIVGIPFTIEVDTAAGTSTYTLVAALPHRKFRVLGMSGYMTGAGAAADSIVLKRGTTAITNTIDVSALADTDAFDAAQIDDAANTVDTNQSLVLTTASDALAHLCVSCVWVD